MPAVLNASVVREAHDGFVLAITARHALFFGEEDHKVYHARGRIPNIDILTRGDVVLALSGVSNNRPVSAAAMKLSTPSKYFRNYLQMARCTWQLADNVLK